MRTFWFVWPILTFVVPGPELNAQRAAETDNRTVWEYTGGFGRSWFVKEGGRKWVLYRGDGPSYLYVEDQRTPAYIEMHGPYTGLLIRLSNDRFESRRSADQPWRRSASGAWVTADQLPEHLRSAPTGYQIRLVYFVPTDREPAVEYLTRIRLMMSMVAELLDTDLRSQGLQPKPLEFESRDGQMLVHLIRGREAAAFYTKDAWPNTSLQARRIHDEIRPTFGDPERHLTIVFAETYDNDPAEEAWNGHIAIGSANPPEGGFAVYSAWVLKDLFSATTRVEQVRLFFDETRIPGRKAFGSRLPNSPRYEFVEDAFGAVLHELGHALGCPHDYRNPGNIMGSGFRQLRNNLDPATPASRRVGFSDDNARMLMCSRYLATDLSLDDYDPPSVTMKLERRGRTLMAVIEAEDETGLRAMLLRTLEGRASTVIDGQALRGKAQKVVNRLPADVAGKPGLRLEAFVSDDGGNISRVTASLDGN